MNDWLNILIIIGIALGILFGGPTLFWKIVMWDYERKLTQKWNLPDKLGDK